PSQPYSPFKTLRPYFWVPFAATDAAGTTVGALTAGSDIVGRHEYNAAAWWSIDGKQPGWTLNYTSHAQNPDLTLSASRDVVDVAGVGCNDQGFCTTQRDVHLGGAAL